jgi:hypothetical protein
MRVNQAAKLYMREMMGSLAIYAVLLVLALKFGPRVESMSLRTVVMLSPMLGFFLALWAVVRHFQRVDEYIVKSSLENVAIAAAITAGWTFTYGFLENAGYPRLTMFTVWPAMGTAWGVIAIVRNWTGR